MTSIRRVPGGVAAPAVPVAKKTAAPVSTARAQDVSSFNPISLVKRLVEEFKHAQQTTPQIIEGATKQTDWFNAPVQVNGINGATDVNQGSMGDCYFVSAVASVANQHPELLKDGMRENADGTVSFRFFQRFGDQFRPTWVTVTRELPVHADGSLTFGSSNENEAWFPLMEKAYARFKSGSADLNTGYQRIGNAGPPVEAQQELLGVKSTPWPISSRTPAQIFDALKNGLANGEILEASSPPKPDESKPSVFHSLLEALKSAIGGIVPNHAYSVWGTQEHDGKQYVLLRNPWGTNEPGSFGPFALDGNNDGVFAMPVEDFVQRFAWVTESAPIAA
jgi:hypothetical protein